MTETQNVEILKNQYSLPGLLWPLVLKDNFYDRKGNQEWLKFQTLFHSIINKYNEYVGVNVQKNLFPTDPPPKHQVNLMNDLHLCSKKDQYPKIIYQTTTTFCTPLITP